MQQLAFLGLTENGKNWFLASDAAPNPQQWIWQIEPMCDVRRGDCLPGEYCAESDSGVFMDINVKPLAQPGDRASGEPPVVEPDPAPGRPKPFDPPPTNVPVGSTYTGRLSAGDGCVDISQLDLPPTPEEVYEQFIIQPIPGLGLTVQPPDLGLVTLPEIYFTTEPTTGDYTVDIRGYTVVISTAVAQFRWYTGDPAEPMLVSDGPAYAVPVGTTRAKQHVGGPTAQGPVPHGPLRLVGRTD